MRAAVRHLIPVVMLVAACDGGSTELESLPTPTSMAGGRPVSTEAPSPAATPAPTTAPVGEAFGLRWVADVGGEVVNTQSQDSTLYAAFTGARGFEIAAIDIDDGEIRWSVAISERGEFDPDFSLATTSNGVMTSFLDDDGGHVVLLDGETGDRIWDIPIEHYAYELNGEIVDGVGALWPTEGSTMIVDLRTGEELDGLDIMFAIDGRGAVQEGSVLRVDLDPLDPSTGGREIHLGDDAPVSGAAQFDDTLLVVTETGTVSGYVGDQQRWALDLGAMQIADVAMFEDVLVVTEGSHQGNYRWHYFAIDGAEPTPIDGVHWYFELEGTGLVDGTATIVGRVDTIQQMQVIALETGKATTLGTLEVTAFATVAVLGDYVVVGEDDDEDGLQVFTLDGLEKSGTVPVPFETGGFAIGDGYLLVIDGAQILYYR